ncbi:MAG: hypothetical protein ACOVS5_03145 [Oligoflexus sp.]
MKIHVDPQPIGKKLNRLVLTLEGQYIGEYERSQLADVQRKTAEVACASELLNQLYQQYGELKVRWNGMRGEKIIYAGGVECGVIPKDCWKKPSWVK